MAYVILSRVTSLHQIFLKEFDQKKIYCSPVAKAEIGRLKLRASNLQDKEWHSDREKVVKISSINAQSLYQHNIDLARDQFIMQSDIIAIQETWLHDKLKESINDYKEFYVHGGSKGISLLTKNEPLKTMTFQSNCCSLIKATYLEFDIINIYRFSDSTNIKQFSTEVNAFLDAARTQVIAGDINIDLMKNPENIFTKKMKEKGFEQKVTRSTHNNGGAIDHIYFYSPSSNTVKMIKYHPVYWSDHICLSFTINLERV